MKKLIPLAAAACLLLSGCQGSIYSNFRETEHLLPVQTLCLDTAEEGARLSLSGSRNSAGSGGGSALISREGESLLRCLDSVQSCAADRELYYAHARFLLLGEDYALRSAAEALDFVARDNRLRLGLDLCVVRGGEASRLITDGAEGDQELSKVLSGLRREAESGGATRFSSCREVIRSLSRHGAALVCALSPEDTEGSVFGGGEGLSAAADGCAVLKEGLLAGYLPRELVPAAKLLLGEDCSAVISVRDSEGETVELEIGRSSCGISRRDSLFAVKAELSAVLAETGPGRQHVTDRDYLAALEEALSRELKADMEAVLALSQALEADFLGLGSWLKSSEKSENWLKNAVFTVDCSSKIHYSRALADKTGSSGGGQ